MTQLDIDLDLLGQRIQAAKERVENAKSTWAKNHWQQTLVALQHKWHAFVLSKDAGYRYTTQIGKVTHEWPAQKGPIQFI